jgi:hypothetical protein
MDEEGAAMLSLLFFISLWTLKWERLLKHPFSSFSLLCLSTEQLVDTLHHKVVAQMFSEFRRFSVIHWWWSHTISLRSKLAVLFSLQWVISFTETLNHSRVLHLHPGSCHQN